MARCWSKFTNKFILYLQENASIWGRKIIITIIDVSYIFFDEAVEIASDAFQKAWHLCKQILHRVNANIKEKCCRSKLMSLFTVIIVIFNARKLGGGEGTNNRRFFLVSSFLKATRAERIPQPRLVIKEYLSRPGVALISREKNVARSTFAPFMRPLLRPFFFSFFLFYRGEIELLLIRSTLCSVPEFQDRIYWPRR